METKRTIEIFSAGCAACEETATLVKQMACPSCDVTILDMHNAEVARRAKSLGIRTVPAVVINGTLADCCAGRGVDEATLRAAGVGEGIRCCGIACRPSRCNDTSRGHACLCPLLPKS